MERGEEEEEEDQLLMMTIGRGISPEDRNHPTFEPSWKLYENPFYISPLNHQPHHQHLHHSSAYHHRHILHLPLSNSRKIAAASSSSSSSSSSFSAIVDLAYLRASMDSELQLLRAQIKEVRSELEHERKARKKVEHANKKLGKELAEERRGREALERVCEKLAREVSSDKADIDRMKREMEEERKMLRLAEVLREERVQMKLAEARVLLEEKIQELETAGRSTKNGGPSDYEDDRVELVSRKIGRILLFGDRSKSRLVLSEKKSTCSDGNVVGHHPNHVITRENSSSARGAASVRETASGDTCDRRSSAIEPGKAGSTGGKACGDHDKNGAVSAAAAGHRRPSPEPENPHIKRGIKGFVEFPRVVRAIGSKSSRHWGTKLECQKAQIRILLKQKSAPAAAARSSGLIWS
ncbi:hypothetical protein BT93_K1953 [Corymbia citriodora subsp. variegata]|nr:hypothetical protein BT93_K1953 [Corymbia citriodora subsp. variegata]